MSPDDVVIALIFIGLPLAFLLALAWPGVRRERRRNQAHQQKDS